jgi:hypothetical protein
VSDLPKLLHDGALATGVSALLYTATIAATAATAVLARSAARRRAALQVLALLLRRRVDRRDQP